MATDGAFEDVVESACRASDVAWIASTEHEATETYERLVKELS